MFLLLLAMATAPLARAEVIQLTQADGEKLQMEQVAARIITLSPHLTELVFAAGAGDALLATVEYSEFPAAATSIPRVGDAFRLDIERIVALNPDLVIAWDSGNPKAAVQQLQRLGLAVWSVEIREPGEIASVLQEIGRAAGTSSQADEAASEMRKRLRQLHDRYRGAETLDYFYQVDSRPLYTINGKHLISQGLALCGGRNIFAGQPGLAFQVGHESVITANPDAFFAPYLADAADPLSNWREWPELEAVRSDALFLLPADEISRATPRWLDSLELACTLLHGLR